MSYDFKKNLDAMIQAREKAITELSLQRVILRFTAQSFQATTANALGHFVDSIIHEAIAYMHLYERTERARYLDSYFGSVQTAISIIHGHDLLMAYKPQIYRRLGDYFYEVGDHKVAYRWYETGFNFLDKSGDPEFLAPLGREVILSEKSTVKGLSILKTAVRLAERKHSHLPDWHFNIIRSGVYMKYAEALTKLERRVSAKKFMLKAKRLCEWLEAHGYHQRLIQWHRLNRKLKILPFASPR